MRSFVFYKMTYGPYLLIAPFLAYAGSNIQWIPYIFLLHRCFRRALLYLKIKLVKIMFIINNCSISHWVDFDKLQKNSYCPELRFHWNIARLCIWRVSLVISQLESWSDINFRAKWIQHSTSVRQTMSYHVHDSIHSFLW